MCFAARVFGQAVLYLIVGAMTACATTARDEANVGLTAPNENTRNPSPVYELRRGNDLPVCKAYARMLRSGPALRAAAECASAGLPVAFDGIAALELREPYDALSDSVIDEIVELLWKRDANPAWYFGVSDSLQWRAEPAQIQEAKTNFRADVKRRIEAHSLQAGIDIDNDGRKEWILYITYSICSDTSAMPVVLTEDRNAIDYEKTNLLARHPPRSDSRWRDWREAKPEDHLRPGISTVALEDAFNGAQYTFFTFAGKTYFALRWLGLDSDVLADAHAGQGKVFLGNDDEVTLQCEVELHHDR
jgi:hypothetical protein